MTSTYITPKKTQNQLPDFYLMIYTINNNIRFKEI